MAKKNNAPAGAGNTDKGQECNAQKSSKESIDENKKKGKAETTKKKKVKYTLENSMKTIAIKIYKEQLGDGGLPAFIEAVTGVDENKVQVIAIIHNKDYQGDDFFAPSIDKEHIHLIARVMDGKPRKIRTWLNAFTIKLRPDEDAKLWEHAVESAKNFEKYSAYLTHQTKEAVEDGKARYRIDELITNLSHETIQAIQLPYIYTGMQQPTSATIDEQANWIEIARRAGYDMENYEDFENTVPLVVMKQIERRIKSAYNQGVRNRVEEVRRSNFTRCSIFIKGKANLGKTYACVHTFNDMGYNVICIDGGTRTGKFDKLTAHHDVMILDDARTNNVLGLADDKPCECYRRNNENPSFIGVYLVVTSNYDFDEWCKRCGIDDAEELNAARSRFFICEMAEIDGQKYLRVDSRVEDLRGNSEKRQKKVDMMYEFKVRFEEYVQQYQPDEIKVDDSKLWANDPTPKFVKLPKVSKQGITYFGNQENECLPFDDGTTFKELQELYEKKYGKK
jgi:hypothetical protein